MKLHPLRDNPKAHFGLECCKECTDFACCDIDLFRSRVSYAYMPDRRMKECPFHLDQVWSDFDREEVFHTEFSHIEI
ncbi:MAG: hypothetical protein GF344_03720 [Chitinivibrionales bacterium]|nr:hypothetical protein [Chitinivibrionales bacterium]